MPKAIIFTKEQESAICAGYQSGKSSIALAREIGVHYSTICDFLERNGIARRNRVEARKDQRYSDGEILERYQQGQSMDEIAKALGTCHETIRLRLISMGVERRSRSAYSRRKNENMNGEILERYQQGQSMNQIAEACGFNRLTVKRRLEMSGATLRKRTRQTPVNESVFDSITEESAYWVGFLMADGCITKDRQGIYRHISLQLAEQDRSHVEAFKTFLQSSNKVSRQMKRHPHKPDVFLPSYRFRVCSQRLADALAKYGIVARKSLTAKVAQLENDRHFWRGVVDGDGCVASYNGMPQVVLVGSLALLEQFRAFVLKLAPDFKASILRRGKICSLNITGRSAFALLRELYTGCAVALPRKLETAKRAISRAA